MDNHLATHLWWSVHAAFTFLCWLGFAFLILWIIGGVIGASLLSRRKRRGDHRVGGVLPP